MRGIASIIISTLGSWPCVKVGKFEIMKTKFCIFYIPAEFAEARRNYLFYVNLLVSDNLVETKI
jgi:hypothetical protein